MSNTHETYISIDVETAGPNPTTYSLLSIGACSVFEPEKSFYIELQPVNENRTSEAIKVSGLKWEQLKEEGCPPKEAMEKFTSWVHEIIEGGSKPIFVAFNAPFDWMFINDYFHRFLGQNPFGHKALDIKAFYMGLHGVPWEETGMQHLSPRYLNEKHLTHHALQDALDQAEIFRKLLTETNN